jgi:hypothetical protein
VLPVLPGTPVPVLPGNPEPAEPASPTGTGTPATTTDTVGPVAAVDPGLPLEPV